MYKFVQKQRSRNGSTVYYFRRSKGELRIRLPDDPHSAEFRELYLKIFNGEEVLLPPPLNERRRAESLRKSRSEAFYAMNRARRRAQIRGKEFDLDLDWVVAEMERTDYLCPLTGIKFDAGFVAKGRMRPFSPSIDRLDNSKGYTRENCRVIVSAMNVMLNDWGEGVFETVARGYNRQRKRTLIEQTNPSHGPEAPLTEK